MISQGKLGEGYGVDFCNDVTHYVTVSYFQKQREKAACTSTHLLNLLCASLDEEAHLRLHAVLVIFGAGSYEVVCVYACVCVHVCECVCVCMCVHIALIFDIGPRETA